MGRRASVIPAVAHPQVEPQGCVLTEGLPSRPLAPPERGQIIDRGFREREPRRFGKERLMSRQHDVGDGRRSGKEVSLEN